MDDFEDDADDFFALRPPAVEVQSRGGQGVEPKSSKTLIFADDAVEDWPELSAKSAKAVSFVDEAVDECADGPRIAASGVVTFVDDDLDNPSPKYRQSSTPRPSGRPLKRRGGWMRLFGSMAALLLLLAGGYAAYRTFVDGNPGPSSARPTADPAESIPAAAVAPAVTPLPAQSTPLSVGPPSIDPAPASRPAPSPPPAAEARKPVRTAERPQRKKARPQPTPSEAKAASSAAPVENVACILPSGQEVRMPYLACRARSGVIYR